MFFILNNIFVTGIKHKNCSPQAELHNMLDAKFDFLTHIRSIALEAREILIDGQIDAMGELLHSGWGWKSRMSDRVSNAEIDAMYNRAREAGAFYQFCCNLEYHPDQ